MLLRLLRFMLLVGLIALYRLEVVWTKYVPMETYIIKPIAHFAIFWVAGQFAVDVLSWMYRRRKRLKWYQRDTVTLGLQNILYIMLAGAAFLTVLSFWNIDFRTLFTSLSIVAAAIAIVSKDYISEIISGIIISFSGEIAINDYIKIGQHKGKVTDLTLTKVALLNEDDDIIFIPNNKVYSNELVNYTQRATRRVSIEFEIGFAHLQTIEGLERELIESLNDYANDIDINTFYLRVVELRKDSLYLKFQYTIHQRERELERAIRKKTIRKVVNHVKQNWRAAAQVSEPQGLPHDQMG